jgi:ribonucleoside-diphosphate reductase alpha chain
MGITNNEEIPFASSIIDYIFKYLAFRCLSDEELFTLGLKRPGKEELLPLKSHPTLFVDKQEKSGKELSGPPCQYCGGLTVRSGSCYTCTECGETSGGCG